MPNVLVIDNYDSFTWNLVQEMGQLGATLTVRRNDEVTLNEIADMNPDGIVLSPGPGRPENAGITCSVVEKFAPIIPILGVCLGHQAIGVALGAKVVRASQIMHGKVSDILHLDVGIFQGLASPLIATRYHSLVIDPATLPDTLVLTAWTSDGTIMGVRHTTYPLEGVQFHPESVLTVDGLSMLENFLNSLN